MSEVTEFSFPTRIRFGAGARSSLADFAGRYRVERPLLVTDPGLLPTSAYRLITRVMRQVWGECWSHYDGVHPNPVEQDVNEAWEAYAAGGSDGVIGLGGGSALDAAKATRLKVAFPELALADMPLGDLPVRLAPFCAIPTTAGTGSEVGRTSVVTLPALGRKVGLFAPSLLADLAILDAELTVDLPPHLTAATGLDALTHAIESYVCPVFHPMCDAIALEAIRLVRRHLPRAYADGADLEARGMMLMAAAMGAVAFQKDLGVAHSLAHPLSSEFGIHHGLANAIVLPATIRFNGAEVGARYERVAEALGLDPGADPAGQTADFLDDFIVALGITQRLGDLGVPREALPGLAVKAMADVCHLTNPRRCSEPDMLRLYQEVW